MSLAGFAVSEYMEAIYNQLSQHKSLRRSLVEVSAAADSQLNHVLKNRLIGASFILMQLHSTLLERSDVDPDTASHVEQVISQLRITVDWIHRREMFLQLCSDIYKSSPSRINVKEVLKRTLSGSRVELTVRKPLIVETDEAILALMLEEGLSNAQKYKAEGSVPSLLATTCVDEDGRTMLRVTLDNLLPANRPILSPEQCVAAFQEGQKGAT